MIPRLAAAAHDCLGIAMICFAGGGLMILHGSMEGFLLLTLGFLLLVAGLLLLPLRLLVDSDPSAEPGTPDTDGQPPNHEPEPDPAPPADDQPPDLDLDTDPLQDFQNQR